MLELGFPASKSIPVFVPLSPPSARYLLIKV